MSDTVIRLIERRSVGDKYILVSINILTFLDILCTFFIERNVQYKNLKIEDT